VRGLLASGLVPRRLDARGLALYLRHQTVPTPGTLVEHVEMIPPGHLLTVSAETGEVQETEYWNILEHASSDAGRDDAGRARERVGALLLEAIDLHLVSDVPVGIFLSGGIDSSVLVALARARGHVPRTFSVVLPGSAHDEGRYAASIARRYSADHHEIALNENDIRAGLPALVSSVDHPSGDGVNTYVVARAVRAAGIKVALSGLGGDEFFGGYPSFARLRRLAAFAPAWRRSPRLVRSAAAVAVRAIGGDSVGAAKAAAVLETDGSIAQAFPILRGMFSPAEQRRLLGEVPASVIRPYGYDDLLASSAARGRHTDTMSLVSYAEARTYMHDVLLRDTDQMTMAHGLEARVPLLDHRLVEYVMGLPEASKAPGATPKRLLVESLPDPLPDECVTRPKQGFVLPFDHWMRTSLRDFCEHHLLRMPASGGTRLYEPSAVADLWRAFLSGDARTTWSRPWTLVALDAWVESNRLTW
jgi:asparagine synthase (glutamine-hydrolysing)